MTELTPEQKGNLELARDGLGSWIDGDRESTIATFSEDIEVFVPSDLGNAGRYRGIEQFRSWFQAWDEVWTDYTMEVRSIEAVGDSHVVALVDSRGKGTASGIEVGNTLGWVLGVDDDNRLDYLALQPDLETAREHARAREAR